ncbi:MgtC/SapB family protein [Paenibacillus crassostreae]|uniref:Magnesium transporter MgtC n=1 Tax=Paenibacillus crassostreae TaxID=1763538 RepID=A0A167ESM5_9BACL|nr:MgtC/SapB family protein [Paenibacillus crassostreae]AOZ93504.1 magnesium transporter MgtC [Paenibacillus crassostreae]OAB75841.1 magnesium transporter MgtC [Paenibacillus crassostreae]
MNNPWIIDDLQIFLRLLLSMGLGGVIGWERERSNRAAGLRTHILVCLGSTLIMMLSIYGFSDFVNEANIRIDPARLAASVITGIGFLGAGTILFTGKSITGLTTAASVWVVAALGLSVGAGFHFAAIVTTIFILMTLVLFNKIEQRFLNGDKIHLLTIQAVDTPELIDSLSKLLLDEGLTIKKININECTKPPEKDSEQKLLEISLQVRSKKKFDSFGLANKVRSRKEITMITVE